jgi:hypothetical protein
MPVGLAKRKTAVPRLNAVSKFEDTQQPLRNGWNADSLDDFRLPAEKCALLGYTQRVVMISYRHFGTTHWSHPYGSRIEKKARSPNTQILDP